MKNIKSVLIGASLLATLTVAGCAPAEEEVKDNGEGTESEGATPLHIPKPELLDVEDENVDVSAIQEKLDELNEGKRLDGYEPFNDEERVMDVPSNPEYNDSVYTKIKPTDLHDGTHLVYIGRKSCPYCNMLRYNLDPVLEQTGIPLEHIDTDNKVDEAYLVENFGLTTVPQIAVFQDGEPVATFPQANMYLENGVDYTSLANGMADMTNIYLSFKHDVPLEEEAEEVEESTPSEDTDETSSEEEDSSVNESESDESEE